MSKSKPYPFSHVKTLNKKSFQQSLEKSEQTKKNGFRPVAWADDCFFLYVGFKHICCIAIYWGTF